MNSQEIKNLLDSDEAPYNRGDLAIWIHDQIVEKIRTEIEITSVCNNKQVLYLPSLKKAE